MIDAPLDVRRIDTEPARSGERDIARRLDLRRKRRRLRQLDRRRLRRGRRTGPSVTIGSIVSAAAIHFLFMSSFQIAEPVREVVEE